MEQNHQLKEAGLKVTLPRLKILHIFDRSEKQHLSAEEIYQKLLEGGEEVGLATVYRVLSQFEASGLLKRHHFEGGYSVFELSEGDHHDHLFCMYCRKVIEFCDELIEMRQKEVAKQFNFQMTDHALIIYGICEVCMGAGAT